MSGNGAARGPAITTGHGCWPPSVVPGTASTVFINNLPAVKQGDAMIPHTCVVPKHPTHGSSVSKGSSSVNVEGKQAVRIGDPIGCGSVIAQGSSNVFIGG